MQGNWYFWKVHLTWYKIENTFGICDNGQPNQENYSINVFYMNLTKLYWILINSVCSASSKKHFSIVGLEKWCYNHFMWSIHDVLEERSKNQHRWSRKSILASPHWQNWSRVQTISFCTFVSLRFLSVQSKCSSRRTDFQGEAVVETGFQTIKLYDYKGKYVSGLSTVK